MREQQQQSSSSQHHADLIALAEMAGVRVQEDVMKILIELLDMNVQPSDLYHTLRDIVVKRSRANRSNARHSSRRSATRSLESSGTPPVVPGTSPRNDTVQ